MTETHQTSESATPSARCLWCGADRPVDVDVCPSCHHAWIDATIEEARQGRLDGLGGLGIGGTRSTRRRGWVLAALIVVVVAVAATVFAVNSGSETSDPTAASDAAASDAAAVTTTVASPSTVAVTTTAAPSAAADTTTTSTSTTSTSTTTTTTTTTLAPILLVEPGYDPADLTLGAFALGPIRFGSSDPDVVGRLAATFGQPLSVLPAGKKWGLCPEESGRVIEFGYLTVIMRDGANGEEFVGYRQRLKIDRRSETDDPSASLRTISGLALGDRLSTAQRLYARVVTGEIEVQQDETLPPGSPIYIVQRSSDGRTLIWGELTEEEDPVILSINSANSCDGGPAPG